MNSSNLQQSPDCAPKKHDSQPSASTGREGSPGPVFRARKKHQFLKILTKFSIVQKEELPISPATFWVQTEPILSAAVKTDCGDCGLRAGSRFPTPLHGIPRIVKIAKGIKRFQPSFSSEVPKAHEQDLSPCGLKGFLFSLWEMRMGLLDSRQCYDTCPADG